MLRIKGYEFFQFGEPLAENELSYYARTLIMNPATYAGAPIRSDGKRWYVGDDDKTIKSSLLSYRVYVEEVDE